MSELDFVPLISLSVMLILLSKVIFDITTEPVPPGSSLRSAFDEVAKTLSLKIKLSMVTVPSRAAPPNVKVLKVVRPDTFKVELNVVAPVIPSVPSTLKLPSMFTESLKFTIVESLALMEVPPKPIPPITTCPLPCGTKPKSSFDLVASMLLPLILIAGNAIEPVPDGCRSISAFELLVVILLLTILMFDAIEGRMYSSSNIALILLPACLIVSPVPSLALFPISMICCAIDYYPVLTLRSFPLLKSCPATFGLLVGKFAIITTDVKISTAPVPDASICKFALDSLDVILLSVTVTEPKTISPVPFAVIVTSLFVVKLVMAESVICNESISTTPVPFGCTFMLPFVTDVVNNPVSPSPTS